MSKRKRILTPENFLLLLNRIESTCLSFSNEQDSKSFRQRIDDIFDEFKLYDKTRIFSTIPLPQSHLNFLSDYPFVLEKWFELKHRCHRRAERVHLLKYPQDAWQATDPYSFLRIISFLKMILEDLILIKVQPLS